MYFDSDDEHDHEELDEHGSMNFHGEYADQMMRPITTSTYDGGLYHSSYCPHRMMDDVFLSDEGPEGNEYLEEHYRLTQSDYTHSRPIDRQDRCSQRGNLPRILERFGDFTLRTLEQAAVVAASILQKKILDQRNGRSPSAGTRSEDGTNSQNGSEAANSWADAVYGSSGSPQEECKGDEEGLKQEINEFISCHNRNYDTY